MVFDVNTKLLTSEIVISPFLFSKPEASFVYLKLINSDRNTTVRKSNKKYKGKRIKPKIRKVDAKKKAKAIYAYMRLCRTKLYLFEYFNLLMTENIRI